MMNTFNSDSVVHIRVITNAIRKAGIAKVATNTNILTRDTKQPIIYPP